MSESYEQALFEAPGAPLPQNVLVEVVRHFRPNQPATAILAPIKAAALRDFGRRTLLTEYIRLIRQIDWRRLSERVVLRPLVNLPSLIVSSNGGMVFDDIWPLQVAAAAINSHLRPELEARHHDVVGCAADIFLVPGPIVHPDCRPLSTLRLTSRVAVSGIECKAVASQDKLTRRLREAAKQLAVYDGGIVALDVSRMVLDRLRARSASDFEAAADEAVSCAEDLLFAWLKGNRQRCKSVAIVMVHARAISDPVACTVSATGSVRLQGPAPTLLREFVRIRAFPNATFQNRRSGLFGISQMQLKQLLEAIFAFATVPAYVVDMKGLAFTGELNVQFPFPIDLTGTEMKMRFLQEETEKPKG